jgi:REP element-mobilizing transposase RayT
VFSTKNREPLLLPGAEIDIHQHMFQKLKKLDCVPIVINGSTDHVHMLFGANYKMSLMDIMKNVKGETSHWANSNRIMPYKLLWQDGFSAFSVSESNVDRVKRYILNQKQHHSKKSYEEEVDDMIAKFGVIQF